MERKEIIRTGFASVGHGFWVGAVLYMLFGGCSTRQASRITVLILTRGDEKGNTGTFRAVHAIRWGCTGLHQAPVQSGCLAAGDVLSAAGQGGSPMNGRQLHSLSTSASA